MTFIELHLIQNFAPSCLNRDDTNTPKDCVFGGVRRARISSQCIKRAIRQHTQNGLILHKDELGVRTKYLMKELQDRFKKQGKDQEESARVISTALLSQSLKLKENKTEYLLFLGRNEIDRLAEVMLDYWDELKEIQASSDQNEEKKDKKKDKKKKKREIPKEAAEDISAIFDGKKAADVALFGRMVADTNSLNVDAACQVAHAISTHKVEMEMDFFTAVDDLLPEDAAGAGMMGTVEFNSACFYRYAVINYEKLIENLGSDKDLANRTVEAFLRASIEAIPTGKQNTFAAHNPPSFMLAAIKENGAPWSLANAFEKAVRSKNDGLVAESVKALDQYWGQLLKLYGSAHKKIVWSLLDQTKLDSLKPEDKVDNVKDFIDITLGELS